MAKPLPTSRCMLIMPRKIFELLSEYAELLGVTPSAAGGLVLQRFLRAELLGEHIAHGAVVLRRGEKPHRPLAEWAAKSFGDGLEPEDLAAFESVDRFFDRQEKLPFQVGDVLATAAGRRLVVTRLEADGEIAGTRWQETGAAPV